MNVQDPKHKESAYVVVACLCLAIAMIVGWSLFKFVIH